MLTLCAWQVAQDTKTRPPSRLLQDAHLKETTQQATPSELLDDLSESCCSVASGSVFYFATIRSEQMSASYAAGLCFYRAEDWWTYEVCYKRHVRQFHREHTQDGSMKIAVEYSLGNYNASAVDTDLVQVSLRVNAVVHARVWHCS